MTCLRLLVVFALLVAPIPARAQTVRVIVRDTAGKRIPAALVRLIGDSVSGTKGASLASASTDRNGEVVFANVPSGARRLQVMRVGHGPVWLPLGRLRSLPDSVVVVLEAAATVRARQAAIEAERHRTRVALARSRPRDWVCTLGDSIAHSRARAAYSAFAGGAGEGMQKVSSEYGMPDDVVAFTRIFVTPLSTAECARFAAGLDRMTNGLETDTVEVYRFGKAFYLPWFGGYDGGFANADGKVLTVFIVPD